MTNPILDVVAVLDPAVVVYKNIVPKHWYLSEGVTATAPERGFGLKKVPMTYLERDPGICGQNP